MKKVSAVLVSMFVVSFLAAQAPPPPAAVPPISAERLKPFYVEFLELQLAQERLAAQQKDLDARKADVAARLKALYGEAKVNPAEWEIDFKSGAMARKPAPEKPKS